MLRTYRFRIYPSGSQRAKMETTLETCRGLYNSALAERKEAWEKEHRTISYSEQQNALPEKKKETPELEQVHSQVLQNVLHRLNLSFQNFFRRIGEGVKPGYPRFKGKDRWDSFTYPQYGNGCEMSNGKLHLSKIGDIRIFKHREIKGAIKTVAIHRDVGRWYACLSVELPDIAAGEKQPRNAVGIDVGLESLITLSNGEQIKPPKFMRHFEEKLAKEQSRLSKKKKCSANRQKQRLRIAIVHRKIREQRKDFNHKLSRFLVQRYDLIAFEKLQMTGMLKNHCLAKSIADASWSQLMLFTSYKAEEAGSLVEFVDARNTTQACSGCGQIVQKGLRERMHRCPSCGLTMSRDINAARNILMRATQGHCGSNASEDGATRNAIYERGSPTL